MKKPFNVIAASTFFLALSSTAVLAGQVTGLNAFQSGDTISSQQMNDNFNAVKSAVNDNDQKAQAAQTTADQADAKAQQALDALGSAALQCPTDMVQVAPRLCADINESAAATRQDAATNCASVGKRLPSQTEWQAMALAVQAGTITGLLNVFDGDWEWTASDVVTQGSGVTSAILVGGSTFSPGDPFTKDLRPIGDTFGSRCYQDM